MKTPDLKGIEAAAEELLAQDAMELVDLRFLQQHGRWILRFYIDKHGGVTVEDCERASDRLGAVLDAMDAVHLSYTLEVSSPGVDRVLKKERDFQRFAGHRVKVTLKRAEDGRRRFQGYLRGVEEGAVVIENGPERLRLDRETIEEARLDPDIRP